MERTFLESEFLARLRPLLVAGQIADALPALRGEFSAPILSTFLASKDLDVVDSAIRGLGLVGDTSHCDELVPYLAGDDDRLAGSAEDALWRLWMRAGSPDGNAALARAVRFIQNEQFHQAELTLSALTTSEPDFAEAHHQRGLALSLLERLDDALLATRRALRLNANHFAAAAELGHQHLMRSEFSAALRYYRRSLQINPRQPELRDAIPQLEAAVRRSAVA